MKAQLVDGEEVAGSRSWPDGPVAVAVQWDGVKGSIAASAATGP